MASETVSHREYSRKRGERYKTSKPTDSNILRGDGSFTAETVKDAEFKPKRGERYDAVKQGSSDIWKVHLPANFISVGFIFSILRYISCQLCPLQIATFSFFFDSSMTALVCIYCKSRLGDH